MDFGMPVLIFFPNDRRSARVGYGNHREAVLCSETFTTYSGVKHYS